jgi:hypothetical protein
LFIQQLLGGGTILDPDKTVISLPIANPGSIHLAS